MRGDALILGIESSCDETSAAVLQGSRMLSNVIAGQAVHERYGGVVPELASRAHQQHILPVVDDALKRAGVQAAQLDAIAYTAGPGLIGALLVGANFAKGLALSLGKPLVGVNHIEGHILAHFISDNQYQPPISCPYLCLTVSGGHTLITRVSTLNEMQHLGTTRDDAAGEAFDKIGKMLGLPYPAGPHIDRLAAQGRADRFDFPVSNIPGYDFSFSGIKTAVLYFLRDASKSNPDFIRDNLADICASVQRNIVETLLSKFDKAANDTGIRDLAIGGGVSANSGLRTALQQLCDSTGRRAYIPRFEYCTDNAAMIAMAGYIKLQSGKLGTLRDVPQARIPL